MKDFIETSSEYSRFCWTCLISIFSGLYVWKRYKLWRRARCSDTSPMGPRRVTYKSATRTDDTLLTNAMRPSQTPRARRLEECIGQNLAPHICFVVIELAGSLFEETDRPR